MFIFADDERNPWKLRKSVKAHREKNLFRNF